MQTVTALGCRYAVQIDGPPEADVIVFGHGYLMTHRLWDAQVSAFRDRFRCVRLDWRGQGRSEVTRRGYDPWHLADDLLAIVDALGVERFHYAGHSMGGYVGYRLALRAPERIRSLMIFGSSAGAETDRRTLAKYHAVLAATRLVGMKPLLGWVLPILFGEGFRSAPTRRYEVETQKRRILSNDRIGAVRAGRGIFSRDDVTKHLSEITPPTLIVTGTDDVPHPPDQARADHARLPHSEFMEVPACGHTPPVEQPDRTTQLIVDFLSRRGDG